MLELQFLLLYYEKTTCLFCVLLEYDSRIEQTKNAPKQ